MGITDYFKYYLGYGTYLYTKVWSDRQPPLTETISFQDPVPRIDHREYDLALDQDRVAFQSLFEVWEWIYENEFKRAYRRATAGPFHVYVDGKLVEYDR